MEVIPPPLLHCQRRSLMHTLAEAELLCLTGCTFGPCKNTPWFCIDGQICHKTYLKAHWLMSLSRPILLERIVNNKSVAVRGHLARRERAPCIKAKGVLAKSIRHNSLRHHVSWKCAAWHLCLPVALEGEENLLSVKRSSNDGRPDKVFPRFNQSHMSSVRRRNHEGPSEALPAD